MTIYDVLINLMAPLKKADDKTGVKKVKHLLASVIMKSQCTHYKKGETLDSVAQVVGWRTQDQGFLSSKSGEKL